MEPNYVLKTNEEVLRTVNDSKVYYYLKKVLWIIIAINIISYFVFGENIFTQLNSNVRILLIILLVYILFIANKRKGVASPFEIRFYDDYLVVYREKLYYNPMTTHMEFFKFFYKDITKCEYRTETERFNILGTVEINLFKYNKDGSLPKEPTHHKTTDSICYFYTGMSDVDFVYEIEAHSPIKVNIKNI